MNPTEENPTRNKPNAKETTPLETIRIDGTYAGDAGPRVMEIGGEVVEITKFNPPLTGLQYVGASLALLVFLLICSVSIYILVDMVRSRPPMVSVPINVTDVGELEVYKEMIEIYRTQQSIAIDRTKELFTLMVASTLIPVFTAILGYIFGSLQTRGEWEY